MLKELTVEVLKKKFKKGEKERLTEVWETLSIPELNLIWFLRNSGGNLLMFKLLDLLRKEYETTQELIKNRVEMRKTLEGKK